MHGSILFCLELGEKDVLQQRQEAYVAAALQHTPDNADLLATPRVCMCVLGQATGALSWDAGTPGVLTSHCVHVHAPQLQK